MSLIKFLQANGREWYITPSEVVIPHRATEGMTPRKIIKTLAVCDQLCRRFSNYSDHCRDNNIPFKDNFESVAEFESYEKTPELGYRERIPKQTRTPRVGFVYLASGNGSFKIGRSWNLESRERYLTTKLPFPVQIVHTIKAKDCVSAEQYWHERYEAKRVRGEWFNLSESDIVEFRSHLEM